MKTIKISIGIILLFAILYGCKKSSDSTTSSTGKNKIAFIYQKDATEATAYQSLLQANNCSVTLVDSAHIISTDFTKFALVVIGNSAATKADQFASGMVSAISKAQKPLLLLGLGGGFFAQNLFLEVNYGSSANFPTTGFVVLDSTSTLYKSPKKIAIPTNKQLSIYNQSSMVAAFYNNPSYSYPNVKLIAQLSPSYTTYYSVTLERSNIGYFGFSNDVSTMTQTGKDFMVNLTYYVGNLSL